ncbi:MAG: hypothetical protein Kow0099_18890 [Candidatus Abyssubacteria bacterium]
MSHTEADFKQSRIVLVAFITGLFSAVLLISLLSVADSTGFIHAANALAISGKASAFLLKDAVNLRQTLLFASVMGCALSLAMFARGTMSRTAWAGVVAPHVLLPDAHPRHWVVLLSIAALALFTYWPCLRLAFLGEDFQFIMWGSRGIGEILKPVAKWHHYKPLGLFLVGVPARLVGFNEPFYHGFILTLHVANCFFIYLLLERITRKRGLAFMSALIYSVYSMQYEAVFWGEAGYYQFSVLFSLATLWLFVSYLQTMSVRTYGAFVAAFAANIFTYEQGIAALGICLCYEVLIGPRIPRDADEEGLLSCMSLGRKYILPLTFIAALWLIKAVATSHTGVFVTSPLEIARFYVASLMGFLTPGFYFGLAAGLRTAQSPLGLLIVLVLLALFIWWGFRQNRFQLFLFAWMVVALFPNALFGTLSSRNYPLPTIAYVVLLVSFIAWISSHFATLCARRDLRKDSGMKSLLTEWTVAALVATILFANVLSVRDRLDAWTRVTEVANKLTRQSAEIARQYGLEKDIHFLDRPYRFDVGEFWPPPPPFGPSFRDEIAIRSGISRDRIFDHWRATSVPLEELLDSLADNPHAVVFVYDKAREQFAQVETPDSP